MEHFNRPHYDLGELKALIAETTRKAGLQPLLLSSFNFLKAFEEHENEMQR